MQTSALITPGETFAARVLNRDEGIIYSRKSSRLTLFFELD